MRAMLVFGILVGLMGCKATGSGVGSNSAFATYQEDLSASLPLFPDFRAIETKTQESVPLKSAVAVDDELEDLAKRLREKNKAELYFSGYTILVYSGLDRGQAFSARDDMAAYYPDLPTEMQYQEPRYLVKVGRYGYKFEAQKNFSLIKSQFPSARIIQDRFQRKENTPK
jgi:hypothetical protein